MAKRPPEVLFEHVDSKTNKTMQVTSLGSMWIVTYSGSPFNLKQLSPRNMPPPIYRKTMFQNQGHAERLARDLNKMFNVSDFKAEPVKSENQQ